MANELKPCPFCQKTSYLKVEPFFEPSFDGYYGFTVVCSAAGFDNTERGCGSSGGWGETEDDAATAWNTRPAAPVEGFETVAYRHMDTWEGAPKYWKYHERDLQLDDAVTEELVTRSQAEAIIAAQAEHIATLESSLEAMEKRAQEAEADNAALTARVKELEAYVKREAQSSPHNAKDCLDEQLCAEALGTQLAALKDAAKSVEDWWINEGMNHFPGAPYCIFAIRAALEAKP